MKIEGHQIDSNCCNKCLRQDNMWVTYRMADGELVWGEYAFVTETEFFDDLDYPVEVVKETWVLQDSETIVFEPTWWSAVEEDEETCLRCGLYNCGDCWNT